MVHSIERLKEHGGNIQRLAERLGVDLKEVLDFSSNINPYGPPRSVIDAVAHSVDRIGEYPEQQAESFVAAASQLLKIDPQHIVAGNGSIELIYLLPRLASEKPALLVVPSFTEYELALRRSGIQPAYKRAFSAEEAFEALGNGCRDAAVAIVGNPNNPCGYRLEKARLLELIDGNPHCLWVVDEAFVDFLHDADAVSLVKEAAERENLVVLRSLTKMYSIAGLRLGYMVASRRIAGAVREAKYPWSINSMALAAGTAALQDAEFVAESVAALAGEAARMHEELSGIDGLTPYRPSANYILVKVAGAHTAIEMQKLLLLRGIAIRDCSSYTAMDEFHFRVAVKRPEDNDRLLDALRSVFA